MRCPEEGPSREDFVPDGLTNNKSLRSSAPVSVDVGAKDRLGHNGEGQAYGGKCVSFQLLRLKEKLEPYKDTVKRCEEYEPQILLHA